MPRKATDSPKHILVVGAGYVGLVTSTCFAEVGYHVTCLDIDKKKIKNLQNGKIPIYEPGLQEMVHHNLKAKRLDFTSDYSSSVKETSICFLALPTPQNDDGSANTTFIESAVKEIAKNLEDYLLIVTKSTVPMGTGFLISNLIQEILKERNKTIPFDIASNPEFLKEGSAIADCMNPDRIIIGSNSLKALKTLRELYFPMQKNDDSIIEMDILSAEMTKYAANSMLATRISFMNEMAEICDKIGANINFVRKGIGSDARIGPSFLYAGIGYGGSCFPKDIRALSSIAKKLGCQTKLLDAVDSINKEQRKKLVHTIENYFSNHGGIKGKTIAIWGLSFKPDTDDMREAPSLTIIQELLKKGASLRLYDPIAMPIAQELLKNYQNITFCKDEFEAAKEADAVALVTEWKQFVNVDLSILFNTMKRRVLFDGRNQFKPHEVSQKGFDYIGIGTPKLINS